MSWNQSNGTANSYFAEPSMSRRIASSILPHSQLVLQQNRQQRSSVGRSRLNQQQRQAGQKHTYDMPNENYQNRRQTNHGSIKGCSDDRPTIYSCQFTQNGANSFQRQAYDVDCGNSASWGIQQNDGHYYSDSTYPPAPVVNIRNNYANHQPSSSGILSFQNKVPNYLHENTTVPSLSIPGGMSQMKFKSLETNNEQRRYMDASYHPQLWNHNDAVDGKRNTATKMNSASVHKEKGSNQLRIVSCTAESLHHWSTMFEGETLLFELFGSVTSVIYGLDHVQFQVKGKRLTIDCLFYFIDQDPPLLTIGNNIRTVGRMDNKNSVLQSVSLRPATMDEQQFAIKFVQKCDQCLQHQLSELREV